QEAREGCQDTILGAHRASWWGGSHTHGHAMTSRARAASSGVTSPPRSHVPHGGEVCAVLAAFLVAGLPTDEPHVPLPRALRRLTAIPMLGAVAAGAGGPPMPGIHPTNRRLMSHWSPSSRASWRQNPNGIGRRSGAPSTS